MTLYRNESVTAASAMGQNSRVVNELTCVIPPDLEQVITILKSANERDPELGYLLHLATSAGRRGKLCG